MTPEERRGVIVGIIESGGSSAAGDLAAHFGVSEDSIRRDLRFLAEKGLIRRVHGGALPHSPAAVSYEERLGQHPATKRRIAEATSKILAGCRVICFDGGTTALEVARQLPRDFVGTVATVSLPVALELSHRPGLEVIQIGGRISGFSQATLGSDVVDALRRYRFDACVLGVCSIDPIAGMTIPYRDESFSKSAMIEQSSKVVAVASRAKLGTAEPFLIAPASAVSVLVTDAKPNDPAVVELRNLGVEVICVEEN